MPAPKKPENVWPSRNFRVPAPLWDAARDRAAEDGEALSEVIRYMLRRYVAEGRDAKL